MSRDDLERLKEVLASHLENRDTSVLEILSGAEPKWICHGNLEDLRDQVNQLRTMEEANYDLSKNEARVIQVIEMPVPPDEQIELIKKWLADGGQ